MNLEETGKKQKKQKNGKKKNTTVLGRSTMLLGRSTMELGRSTMGLVSRLSFLPNTLKRLLPCVRL